MKNQFEQHPGFLIYDISRLFRQVLGARLRDMELSESRWRVLATLSRFSAISQTQLAHYLAIGRAPLGELLCSLQREGLIERRLDPGDGRVKQLFTTDKAAPIVSLIRERVALLKDQFLEGVSDRQIKELESILQQLYGNLVRLGPDDIFELPPEELTFMHLVSCISRLNRRHFDEQLKALGFTRTQWLVLAGIRDSEGLQQNVLAQELHMSKAPLGVLIDNLEANLWVVRKTHPQDRRAKQLFLTSAFKRKLKSLEASYEQLHLTILAGVSDDRREKLSRVLARVRSNLQTLASQQAVSHNLVV